MAGAWSRRRRFESNFIVDRISESLLAAKVSLRCLDAHVTEQELDLLKFPAGLMTQTSACATHIVRSDVFKAALRTSCFHHAPNDLWAEGALPNSFGFIDGPKYWAGGDAGGA